MHTTFKSFELINEDTQMELIGEEIMVRDLEQKMLFTMGLADNYSDIAGVLEGINYSRNYFVIIHNGVKKQFPFTTQICFDVKFKK